MFFRSHIRRDHHFSKPVYTRSGSGNTTSRIAYNFHSIDRLVRHFERQNHSNTSSAPYSSFWQTTSPSSRNNMDDTKTSRLSQATPFSRSQHQRSQQFDSHSKTLLRPQPRSSHIFLPALYPPISTRRVAACTTSSTCSKTGAADSTSAAR